MTYHAEGVVASYPYTFDVHDMDERSYADLHLFQ